MELLNNLNPMQREAALHVNGPLLLFAGAGSGKTRTLTYRIAYLVQNGVDPYNILAITFTNKAAREMRERLNSLVADSRSMWVSTFHALGVRVLRREADKLGYGNRFTIYDSDDSERIIKACLKELNISDKQFAAKDVARAISRFKNELVTPDEAERDYAPDFRAKTICRLYRLYQKKLRDNNSLDFDDLIFCTVRLFAERPDILGRYQERFKYILVDEYQDTNTSQYMLIKMLADKYKNLCVVGDDDQSIYGWRGADIRNILDFEKDYPSAVVIKLEQNYRSSQTILEAANAVIANNLARKQKRLWTENGLGGGIEYYRAQTDIDESIYIAGKISSAVKRGGAYRDFAVLYRNNAQSRIIEDNFVKNSVPYRLLGGVRFYDRREIKDVLAYLKFLNNPQDTAALMRIINVPRRGIGDVSLERVSAYAAENGTSFFSALHELDKIGGLGNRSARLAEFRELMEKLIEISQTCSVAETLEQILALTGYKESLIAEDAEEARDRIENIDQLLSKAEESGLGLDEFLDEVSLVADVDGYDENDDTVVLMTIHSSKGLEFKNVFITGFEEGIFPGYQRLERDEIEEERRLCYVGITRAKESLTITTAVSRMQYRDRVYNSPSRFLKEIPAELLGRGEAVRQPVRPSISPRQAPQMGRAGMPEAHYAKKTDFGVKAGLTIDFNIGDTVKQQKYGKGIVTAINPSGADFEVTIEFPGVGVKKFMAHLGRITKA